MYILLQSLAEHTKYKIQNVVKRLSEMFHFCKTTILAEKIHEEMTTLGCKRCDRVVRRLSKGCQRGVMGSFLFYEELFT